MITRDIVFLEQYQSELNGEVYEIYKFVDPITLNFLYGTNLTVSELKPEKTYQCILGYKRNKIRVEKVIKEIVRDK